MKNKPMNLGLQKHIIRKRINKLRRQGALPDGFDVGAAMDDIDAEAHLEENIETVQSNLGLRFDPNENLKYEVGQDKLEAALDCQETTDAYSNIVETSSCGKNPTDQGCPTRKSIKEACRCGDKRACKNLKKFDKDTTKPEKSKKPDRKTAAKKRLKKAKTTKAKIKIIKSSAPSGGTKIETPPPIKRKEVKKVAQKKSRKRAKAVAKVKATRKKNTGRVNVTAHTRGRPKRR